MAERKNSGARSAATGRSRSNSGSAKSRSKKAAELEEKIRKNKFDLNDLLDQITQLRKMGSIQDTLAMLPGMGKKLQGVDVDEKQFDRLQALIRSMTPKERENPDIINPSRKRRIAAGSGQKVEDVNRLLNQHKQMQKLFKQFNGKGSKKKMRRMGFDPSKLGMQKRMLSYRSALGFTLYINFVLLLEVQLSWQLKSDFAAWAQRRTPSTE